MQPQHRAAVKAAPVLFPDRRLTRIVHGFTHVQIAPRHGPDWADWRLAISGRVGTLDPGQDVRWKREGRGGYSNEGRVVSSTPEHVVVAPLVNGEDQGVAPVQCLRRNVQSGLYGLVGGVGGEARVEFNDFVVSKLLILATCERKDLDYRGYGCRELLRPPVFNSTFLGAVKALIAWALGADGVPGLVGLAVTLGVGVERVVTEDEEDVDLLSGAVWGGHEEEGGLAHEFRKSARTCTPQADDACKFFIAERWMGAGGTEGRWKASPSLSAYHDAGLPPNHKAILRKPGRMGRPSRAAVEQRGGLCFRIAAA